MKKIIALMVSMTVVSASYGALQINWSGQDGFVRNDGVTPMFDGNVGSYLAQLIWTPDATAAPAFIGGGVTGSEVILDTAVMTFAGDEYGPLFPQDTVAPYAAGNIYVRVFDVGSDNAANITAGSWYYAGPLVSGVQQTDPTVVQVYNIHTGSGGFDGFGTDVLNQQVIPEPSVFAMLGLGGLVLMIRRRFVNA